MDREEGRFFIMTYLSMDVVLVLCAFFVMLTITSNEREGYVSWRATGCIWGIVAWLEIGYIMFFPVPGTTDTGRTFAAIAAAAIGLGLGLLVNLYMEFQQSPAKRPAR